MSDTAIVQEMYGAFDRRDVPAILARLPDAVVWESEGSAIPLVCRGSAREAGNREQSLLVAKAYSSTEQVID